MALVQRLRIKFHNLNSGEFDVKSDCTAIYNCISWAIGDQENSWWPIDTHPYHWPAGLPMDNSIGSFKMFFELHGYQECSTGDLEPGFEKIALYENDEREITHAAKQLLNGAWTSKIGDWEDIEHNRLEGLEGGGFAYGSVKMYLRKSTA